MTNLFGRFGKTCLSYDQGNEIVSGGCRATVGEERLWIEQEGCKDVAKLFPFYSSDFTLSLQTFNITDKVSSPRSLQQPSEPYLATRPMEKVHSAETVEQNYNPIRCNNPQNDQTINLLKSTGYLMHQQFNIQQQYVLPALYLCVLYLSENKQRLVPLTA